MRAVGISHSGLSGRSSAFTCAARATAAISCFTVERLLELDRGPKAMVRITRHRLRHDGLETARDVPAEIANGTDALVHHAAQDPRTVLAKNVRSPVSISYMTTPTA